MQKNSIVSKASVELNASAAETFSFLTNQNNLELLCERPITAEMTSENDKLQGTVTVGSMVFSASVSPYTIELSGDKIHFGLRVADNGAHCKVIAAAAHDEGCTDRITDEALQLMLQKLRTALMSGKIDDALAEKSSEDGRNSPVNSVKRRAAVPKAKVVGKKKPNYAVLFLLAAALCTLLVLGIRALFFGDRRPSLPSTLSIGVTYDNMQRLSLGDDRQAAEQLFGSSGEKHGERAYLYMSNRLDKSSRPVEQVLVRYSADGKAEEITYLNLDVATIIKPTITVGAFTADMSIEQLEAAAGAHCSMIRLCKDSDGANLKQVFFGYVDPFANFSKSWKSELIVTINETAKTVAVERWPAYDGNDSLLISSLDKSNLALQYDDYDKYLSDKFFFDRVMQMKNKYTHGDVVLLFGRDYVTYNSGNGVVLNSLDSVETLPDTDTPVHRMSFGYDSRGGFVMFSYSNMRFFEKAGTLAEGVADNISIGISYSEVERLLGILPTAVFIDETSFSLCYGRFLKPTLQDEQFELVVRFSLATNLVEKSFDNSDIAKTLFK
ncbi:MAG: hypothetical protein RR058_00885 [Oscillospiraceae bacterium]